MVSRLPVFLFAIAKSNFMHLSRPYRINFCVTYRCQSRCKMCNIWKMKPENELSLDEIKAFARNNPYFSWVQLTGGEPYLRQDIADIAAAFEESSHPYIMTSQTNSLCENGSTERKVREIAALKIPRFTFTLSLDGDGETHDFQRGVEGNFAKVMDLYGRLHPLESERDGFKIVFGYTITKFNVDSLTSTIQSVKHFYPWVTEDDFHLNYAQTSHYYGNGGESFQAEPSEAKALIASSLLRRKNRGVLGYAEKRFLKGLISYLETKRNPMKQRGMDASVYMDSFGNVYPSVMWDLKLGNVRDRGYSLEKVLQGPESWTSCEAYQSILGNLP